MTRPSPSSCSSRPRDYIPYERPCLRSIYLAVASQRAKQEHFDLSSIFVFREQGNLNNRQRATNITRTLDSPTFFVRLVHTHDLYHVALINFQPFW